MANISLSERLSKFFMGDSVAQELATGRDEYPGSGNENLSLQTRGRNNPSLQKRWPGRSQLDCPLQHVRAAVPRRQPPLHAARSAWPGAAAMLLRQSRTLRERW